MKVKEILKEKGTQVGMAVMLAAPVLACAAGAVDETDASGTGVVKIISDSAASMKTDALTVIGAAIGLSVVFWAAKTLWNKYRSIGSK